MPPLTYSSSDTDSRSSYEGLEIFYQPVMMDGEACGEARKGYNTHMVAIGSKEANLVDDDSVSITGDMRDGGERDGHTDRTSLLKDIYTTMRMIGVDQRPEKVRRGTVIASLDLDSVEDRIKIPLVSMGGSVEGRACADPGARTPIRSIGFFL